MDDARFDALIRSLRAGMTRRGITRLLAGLALGSGGHAPPMPTAARPASAAPVMTSAAPRFRTRSVEDIMAQRLFRTSGLGILVIALLGPSPSRAGDQPELVINV